jgi:hypothetical protein
VKGSTFASPPAYTRNANNKIGMAYDPAFVASGPSCINGSAAYGTCDFKLQSGSPAVDAGTFWMRARGGGASSTVLNVKQAPETIGEGVNANGHWADPHWFFIAPGDYLHAKGDTLQIAGASCAAGSPALPASQARIASMTKSSIALDRPCTWSDNAGIGLPWRGNAPDMGAFESGSTGTPTLAPPDLLSVQPVS